MLNEKTDTAVVSAPETIAPIQQNPNKLSGSPTIGDYRVHAETLIDYFAEGLTLNNFLEDFDGTPKEDALAVLGVIRQAIRDGMLTGITVREENAY
ncbi:MAG: DUF433 domain-containing protein [Acidobacteria bacterium]|nr:DUF433 domain-containing protein [Acidobacteriota bacterium]